MGISVSTLISTANKRVLEIAKKYKDNDIKLPEYVQHTVDQCGYSNAQLKVLKLIKVKTIDDFKKYNTKDLLAPKYCLGQYDYILNIIEIAKENGACFNDSPIAFIRSQYSKYAPIWANKKKNEVKSSIHSVEKIPNILVVSESPAFVPQTVQTSQNDQEKEPTEVIKELPPISVAPVIPSDPIKDKTLTSPAETAQDKNMENTAILEMISQFAKDKNISLGKYSAALGFDPSTLIKQVTRGVKPTLKNMLKILLFEGLPLEKLPTIYTKENSEKRIFDELKQLTAENTDNAQKKIVLNSSNNNLSRPESTSDITSQESESEKVIELPQKNSSDIKLNDKDNTTTTPRLEEAEPAEDSFEDRVNKTIGKMIENKIDVFMMPIRDLPNGMQNGALHRFAKNSADVHIVGEMAMMSKKDYKDFGMTDASISQLESEMKALGLPIGLKEKATKKVIEEDEAEHLRLEQERQEQEAERLRLEVENQAIRTTQASYYKLLGLKM